MRFSPTPWLVAGIAFVVLGISRGIHTSFGVFNVALLDAFGWSRGATAGIFSIVLVVDAVLSPVVGYLLDRYGTRHIAMAGCVALVAGLLLSSQVTALWQLYISFGLILAVGFTFAGMVPHVFLISEWFSSHRASAIGFVYAGTGVAENMMSGKVHVKGFASNAAGATAHGGLLVIDGDALNVSFAHASLSGVKAKTSGCFSARRRTAMRPSRVLSYLPAAAGGAAVASTSRSIRSSQTGLLVAKKS